MMPFSLLRVTLLPYCLAEGGSPTADGAEGGGVAALITGLVGPNPGSNTVVILPRESFGRLPFALEKTTCGLAKNKIRKEKREKGKEKKTGKKTTQRKKMPRHTVLFFSNVLSFSPCLSQGSLFLQKESWISVKSYMLNEASFLLCELLCSLVVRQWQSPTAGGAEGGGPLQRCSWAKPAQPPGSNLFVIPPKRSAPPKVFFLWKRLRTALPTNERNEKDYAPCERLPGHVLFFHDRTSTPFCRI